MQFYRQHLFYVLATVLGAIIVSSILYLLLARAAVPERIMYGVSFNVPYAQELGLDWEAAYRATLDELGVRHFRLAAHWPLIEPTKDTYNWVELDTQIRLAEEYNATVILGVGRRLPRWPECHVPEWAKGDSWEDQKQELRDYIREVVTRYKDSPAITHWQVENEPFLTVFAYDFCGEFDKAFLDEEIALVHALDPSRPVLVTDSGNLGLWYGAYSRGDAFGTSAYIYLWNPEVGPLKSRLPPSWYRAKAGLMGLLYGKKETMLIELSLEPWLTMPVIEAPLEMQLERMDIAKMEEILEFARETRFEKQYLWGVEWWYWMRAKGHPEYWERASVLFGSDK